MLKIEYLTKQKNVIRGSGELRIMQNNYTPVLDLLVRESIQNSLDARQDSVDTVFVDYLYDTFDVKNLCNEFELIGETIKNRISSKEAKYIAIMDKNTVGLTGSLSGNYDDDEKANENLGKLVYHIMEHQDREGAGGSWGIGKTLYYRIGIGLVIYYSRVLENGKYQDRLVAAVVEDETTKKGLLSSIKGNAGVAWFGNKQENKDVEAIVDSHYIGEFLKTFNIKPLEGKETGTYVIIPFVNEEELLNNNLSEYADKMWWNNNIQDYLYVAVLRWYFPRFSNYYENGPKLNVHINGESVEATEETNTILYKKYIELYDAFYKKQPNNWIKVENIERKTDLLNYNVGKFIYGVINKNEIGVKKYHLPNPKQYALIDDYDNSYPLVCYCRNAGMIVNYELFNKNVGKINCSEDEYIIGLFVVDPKNAICCSTGNIKLDEYLRKGEKSDHSSWEDHPIPNHYRNIKIVDGIYKNIAKILNTNFGEEKVIESESSINISLARKFGRMFLPDAGYGSDPRKAGTGTSSGGGFTKVGKNRVRILNTTYKNKNLVLGYEIIQKDAGQNIKFNNLINTVNGKYEAIVWEDLGFEYPCNIKKVSFQCISRNNKKVNENVVIIDKNSNRVFENFEIEFLYVKNNCYSIIMNDINKDIEEIDFKIFIEIETKDKSIQTYCDIAFGGTK